MKNFLLVLLMLLGANAFAAGINKWVDEQGQVHYSDQPPPRAAKKVLPPLETTVPAKAGTAPAATTPAAPQPMSPREAGTQMEDQVKQETADKATQEQAVADAYKVNCEAAQRNLRILQEGTRIMDIDANGQRYFLSDQERQERIARAQQEIEAYCK